MPAVNGFIELLPVEAPTLIFPAWFPRNSAREILLMANGLKGFFAQSTRRRLKHGIVKGWVAGDVLFLLDHTCMYMKRPTVSRHTV